ncbi:MAG TPA: FHA domain-containing protein [Anaerolineae bacterium]|nr:FHA domain-containing protein [Anaerolineae bacterium]
MKLVVERGVWAGRELRLAADRVTIGRSGQPDAEHIVLPEPEASRRHLRLERGPAGWTVTDLHSTNGTFLNGQRLRPYEPYPLRPGDRLAMGDAVLVIYDEGAPAAASPPAMPPVEAEAWPEEEAPLRQAHPLLRVLGAAALLLVLAGMVLALVLILRPKEEVVPTATPGSLPEQLMTVIPTGLPEMATAILTLVPTGLPPLPPLLGPTPTPESRIPVGPVSNLPVGQVSNLSTGQSVDPKLLPLDHSPAGQTRTVVRSEHKIRIH